MVTKTFDIWPSERCYRVKEEAFYSHAPQRPGVYELVTFDEKQQAKVLFVGLTLEKSIFEALYEHWHGTRKPTIQELLNQHPNLHFDFIMESNAQGPEDLQDLQWALVQQHQSPYNPPGSVEPSGRYTNIKIADRSLL